MRHQSATVHELAQIGLLAELPGEKLLRLAERMERRQLTPGEAVLRQGESSDHFYVVLSGLLSVRQEARGERGVLRPGDYFGEVAIVMEVPRTSTVSAMTPASIATCDRATFDELVRPLFTE